MLVGLEERLADLGTQRAELRGGHVGQERQITGVHAHLMGKLRQLGGGVGGHVGPSEEHGPIGRVGMVIIPGASS